MRADDFAEDVRAAWQVHDSPLTAALLRRTVRRFAWSTRVRDLISVLCKAGLALLWAAFAFASESPLCRIGCALLTLADAYTVYRLIGFSFVKRIPAAGGAATCAFYRAELTRRMEGHGTLARWAIWPAVPGVLLAITGWLISAPEQWKEAIAVAAFWAGAHYAMLLQSSGAAAKLRREIALLDEA